MFSLKTGRPRSLLGERPGPVDAGRRKLYSVTS